MILFSSSENTWEPIEHLSCPELIKVYEDSIKIQPLGRKRKLGSIKNTATGSVPKKKGVSIFNSTRTHFIVH